MGTTTTAGALDAVDVMASADNASDATATLDPLAAFGPARDSLYIVVPITVIYLAIFVVGLFGNVCTCVVITRNKSLHTATNYYLFSLAVSDLLLLVSGMPQEIYWIWSKWPYVFGETFCVLRGLAAETSTNASILTITSFTVERYLAICHPFLSHTMSKLSRAIKHILVVWVLAFAFAVPQALQFGLREHRGVVMCLQTRVIVEHSFEISTFLFFFAPMAVITVLYVLIGVRLSRSRLTRHRSKRCGSMSASAAAGGGGSNAEAGAPLRRSMHTKSNRMRQGQSTRRVVKMLVAVVAAFFICWAPFHAQRLIAIYGTRSDHRPRSSTIMTLYAVITYCSGVLYYLSTAVNPVLYHIMSNKFRDAFKATLDKWCGYSSCHKSKLSSGDRYSPIVGRRRNHSSGTDNSGNYCGNGSTRRQALNSHKRLANKTSESTLRSLSASSFNATVELPLADTPSRNHHQPELTRVNSRDAALSMTADSQKLMNYTISNSSLCKAGGQDLDDELMSYMRDVKSRMSEL